MSLTGLVARGRRAAEALMTDTCEIREPDSWSGEVKTQGAIAATYQGSSTIPCRVKTSDTQPQATAVGGEPVLLIGIRVSLPIDVCPSVDQVITVVSSVDDPSLAGRRFDVRSAPVGSHMTARRVLCEEHR